MATVYIGEGCWGAPLRAADDSKPWTVAADSFNGFDWIQVTPEEILIKTIKVQGSANFPAVDTAAPFETPEGVELWEAGGEAILSLPADQFQPKKPGGLVTGKSARE